VNTVAENKADQPSQDARDVIRYLERRIPVCPQHGVMTRYSRDPRNHNTRYYRCPTCGRTAKGTTRLA
jgi:predicted RNA-binding Zn-ribbon protein involved in translation (DUF1610 family)